MNRSFWLLRGLKVLLFGLLFVALASYVTMRLWNWLLPELFRLPLISIWQALGLLVLSRILFGGWGSRSGRAHWARQRQQWRQHMSARLDCLTPEEKEKFRQKMAGACTSPPWARRRTSEPDPSAPVQ